MKKTTLLAGLLIGSIALLTGCGSKTTSVGDETTPAKVDIREDNSTETTNKPEETEKITKEECLAGCKLAREANEANKENPLAQMYTDCENLCNAQQGMQNNNLAGCTASDNPLLQASCFTQVAAQTKDPAVCKNITDTLIQDTCYTAVAEETKDPTVCDAITNALFKDGCLQGVQNQ